MLLFLFILGVIIAFGSFCYAVLNLSSGKRTIFRDHGYAMIGMAFGGLISLSAIVGWLAQMLS